MQISMNGVRSLTFYQLPTLQSQRKSDSYFSAGLVSPSVANTAYTTQSYTNNVKMAYAQIKSSVIDRGLQYANNSVASRGGFMAENWHAETYNFDATIKRSPTRAEVPATTKLASADIVIDNKTEVSVKYYTDAKSSAKAQTNPGYKKQVLLIPEDQLSDAKESLNSLAEKNIKKGRNDAAEIQKEAAERLTDRIKGADGVSSTPLTKKEDMDIADAIKADKSKSGDVTVDEDKIDALLKKKGISEKRASAIRNNELLGLGLATAIGAGVGLTIGFITSLAQNGVTPDTLKIAVGSGLKGGVESGVLSAVGYGIGRTLGGVASQAATGFLENLGATITQNLSEMVNTGVVGSLTIAVFSMYQFVNLRIKGVETRTALLQVGKQALFSLSILAVSIAAQGVWGTTAGLIVSTSIGIILIAYSITNTIHQRYFAEKVRVYTIEKCRPCFSV